MKSFTPSYVISYHNGRLQTKKKRVIPKAATLQTMPQCRPFGNLGNLREFKRVLYDHEYESAITTAKEVGMVNLLL